MIRQRASFRKLFLSQLLLIGSFLLTLCNASAQQTYTYKYTGNPFTEFINYSHPNGGFFYTSANSLRFSITLPQPLDSYPNHTFSTGWSLGYSAPPGEPSWSISDGVHTITNANASSAIITLEGDGSGGIVHEGYHFKVTRYVYKAHVIELNSNGYVDQGMFGLFDGYTSYTVYTVGENIAMPGKWVYPALPIIRLTKATTVDAKSVAVTYNISQSNVYPSLMFDFYRSDKPAQDSSSTHIGQKSLSTTDIDQNGKPALGIGTHTVTFLSGTSLPPIPKTTTTDGQQYVVVVANGDNAVKEDPGSVNTTYFRKWLLGVVVHGLSFSDVETRRWMTAMCADLVHKAYFDKAIPFYWLGDSVTPLSGETEKNGATLAANLASWAANVAAPDHPGDVVDIHFIGHSRGTVVVAQALQDFLENRSSPLLLGSYVEVTLLDIHPANSAEDGLLDYTGASGLAQAIAAADFQLAADDPEITLPAGAGIMSIDIWYQQTPAAKFSNAEHTLNLWGEGGTHNHVKNNSGIPITWQNLTSAYAYVGGLGWIGHTEIHEYYRLVEIDAGLVH